MRCGGFPTRIVDFGDHYVRIIKHNNRVNTVNGFMIVGHVNTHYKYTGVEKACYNGYEYTVKTLRNKQTVKVTTRTTFTYVRH